MRNEIRKKYRGGMGSLWQFGGCPRRGQNVLKMNALKMLN